MEPINVNKQPVFLRHVGVFDNDPLKAIKDDFFEFKPHHQLMVRDSFEHKMT